MLLLMVQHCMLGLHVSKLGYAFTASTSSWSSLPDSLTDCCAQVIVNDLLTLVGGLYRGVITNQLLSLTGDGSGRRWTEEFPPMPTKRYGSTALCTETALIVAGGRSVDYTIVEVMNTETLQWSTAADLPHPLYNAPRNSLRRSCLHPVSYETLQNCVHMSSKCPHPVM